MLNVSDWLVANGFARFVALFAENEIDGDALRGLTYAHLTELGIPLGARVNLLKAISRLGEAGAGAQTTAIVAPASYPADAGRRQLTVMFCDLVGSTELSGQVDPEEMQEIIRTYQNVCAGVIERFDGYLAKFLGDGVLAYFGYPRAHEDEAERAVRAARRIVKSIRSLPPYGSRKLAVRVGIATGLVVVGQVSAVGGASELSAIGEAPNLAARLQNLAEPNTAVVAEATRALAGGSFRYIDLGQVTLKGIPNPVRAWRVVGQISRTRFEAAHGSGLSAFVGRDQEVALLHGRWEQAASGEGQVVLLCGEGGIGKSRIAEQLRLHLGDTDHIRLRYQCSPFHRNSALQPAIAQLEHAADFSSDDDDVTRLVKLEALLQPTTADMGATVPLFAALLGIPLSSGYAPLKVTADVVKQRTLDALAEQLVSVSKVKPVYWLVEDAHWIDPTTRDLISLCLRRIRDARVFVLITFRPEFVSPWSQMPHATTLTLNRLARRQCAELIKHVCGGKQLPDEVQEQLIAKTDGIPLFIEELTKTVLESGLLREQSGEYVLTGTLPPMAVPASLQDSLMARLDRLSPVREVAQIGAAIGREFTYRLLAAVTQIGPNELASALLQLAEAELLFVRGEPPEATYIFKHALLQDAAYASLLRARRQQLHSRIAQAIEEQFPETPTRRPEILAHHYEAAGLEHQAKEYWARAGRLALSRSAYAEAITHLGKAQALAAKTQPSEARMRELSALILDRGVATAALKGPPSADHGQVAEEAVKTSAALGDDRLHFRARWADWIYHSTGGNLPAASQRADVLVGMANRIGADDLRLQAYHARWTTAFLRGQVAVTRDDVEHGLALYDFDLHKDHWSMYGAHDPGVCARATGACTLWQAGFALRAHNVAEDAISLGHRLGHPFSRAISLWYAAFFAAMVRDAGAATAYAESAMVVASEANLAWPASMAQFIGGWAMSRQGDPGRGVNTMETVFRRLMDAKQRGYLTFLGTLLAEAKLEMRRVDDALNLLDEIQELSAETHQEMFLSELHRVRAEALHRIDPKSESIGGEFQSALEVARHQGALSLELRTATSLASWLADTKGNENGKAILSSVYCRLTEGFDTPDLMAASALLKKLD
jgi:class 3 adenylate cyclase